MQSIHSLFLLIGILTISISTAAQNSICNKITKKGKLVLSSVDVVQNDKWCECQGFTQLQFKNVHVKVLPVCLSANKELISVSFSKTPLQRLPANFELLNQVQSIDVSFTKLVFLPEEIAALTNLKFLNLRGTDIVSLPEGLNHLEKIDMRMIELTKEEQDKIHNQYPGVKIYFSSPCKCY